MGIRRNIFYDMCKYFVVVLTYSVNIARYDTTALHCCYYYASGFGSINIDAVKLQAFYDTIAGGEDDETD